MFRSNKSQSSSDLQGTQVRTFAETAVQEPTVPTHGIHGRYALALFQAGIKQGDLDKIDKDLREVRVILVEYCL